MKTQDEKRRYQRLPLRLSVSCHKVGIPENSGYTGKTINVSPGGMLMEINGHQLSQGDLLSIEMSVPPTKGLLEYGGKFSSYARILRAPSPSHTTSTPHDPAVQTVALEFCASPKLNVL